MQNIELLKKLYEQNSKHANYQKLAPALDRLLNASLSQKLNRFEDERFKFIAEHVNLKNKNILDIGANTGYFSLRAIESGASNITAIEGNSTHAEFLALAAGILGYKSSAFKVINTYFDQNTFSNDMVFDVMFLLNVIHHLGDDFGDKSMTKDMFFLNIEKLLKNIAKITKYLVLQIGYCWKGDPAYLLFNNGTKSDQIEFIKNIFSEYWCVEHIGIAELDSNGVSYCYPSELNLQRDDTLKEFLNRPIFILRSKLI